MDDASLFADKDPLNQVFFRDEMQDHLQKINDEWGITDNHLTKAFQRQWNHMESHVIPSHSRWTIWLSHQLDSHIVSTLLASRRVISKCPAVRTLMAMTTCRSPHFPSFAISQMQSGDVSMSLHGFSDQSHVGYVKNTVVILLYW